MASFSCDSNNKDEHSDSKTNIEPSESIKETHVSKYIETFTQNENELEAIEKKAFHDLNQKYVKKLKELAETKNRNKN